MSAPKKRYGQHFLIQESIAERIASSLTGEGYDLIYEIGPGQGMLSRQLMKTDYERYYLEADRDMVAYMQSHYPEEADRVIQTDVLKYNFKETAGDRPYAVIGNMPYNISSQIIVQALYQVDQVPELVAMLQLEMAQRLAANHGNKTYGILSVLTQVHYDVQLLFKVAPGNFNPPPKVQSAVIRMRRRADYRPDCDIKLLRRMVRQAFNQRRKMMRNTLKGIFPSELLMGDEIFTQRPEHISVADWVSLTRRYASKSL